MIADRPHPQTLPALPAFLCVLGAGFASGAALQILSFWTTPFAASGDVRPPLVVGQLVGTLVGAWALRLLLRGVCGFAIAYWNAYGALIVGQLLGIGILAGLYWWVRHTGGASATSALPTLFGPGLLGLIVSVFLVRRSASPRGPAPRAVTGELFAAPEPARPTEAHRDLYDETVSAARDASVGLVELALQVSPAEAPTVITNGLIRLGVAVKALEEQRCPVPELADAHAQLVEGLKQLEDDLVEAAAEAGRSASDHSDHGARYRQALSESPGLKTVREALDELGRRGFGTTW